ncbi:MAG TPA: hypothetical protein VN815_17390 [Steroidobacteraceae bacterium]|nr:hypothetical protein [Steroidobacteraceae bacterium]
MIAIAERPVRQIAVDERRRSKIGIRFFMALAGHFFVAARALIDSLERHFAGFAAVPYHDASDRQQWEQIWETDLE